MAGRPPLEIGTHGKIRFSNVTKPGGPKTIRAYCQYRGVDGVTVQRSATGASEAKAERNLKANLADRGGGDDITADTRVRVVAGRWMDTIAAQVEAGDRSPSTSGQYRSLLDRHVLPAVGSLRVREATTGRIDRVLTAIKERSGGPTAKSCRTVLSGILGYAARHDAVAVNATRNTSAISVKPRKQPRALTADECGRWLARLAADEKAVQRDLIDLCGFMLAVGTRIGECLAVAWEDVDLDTGIVRIDWTVCRVKGRPLFRKRVKSDAGFRTLRLPPFATAMLRRRVVELHVLRTGILPPAVPQTGEQTGSAVILRMPELILRDSEDVGSGGRSRRSEASFGNSEDFEDFEMRSAVENGWSGAAEHLSDTPVFPDTRGGWRDPSNTRRDLRKARGSEEFAWVTSHVFRKTAATIMDEAGLTARQIADQLGHSRPSLTQDVYMARGIADPRAAAALEQGLGQAFSMHKPSSDLEEGA